MKLEWIYENKVYNNICGENITIFFRFGAWLSYEKEILRFEEIWTRAVNIFDRSKPEVPDKGEDVCLGSTDLAKTFAAQLARLCYRLNHPLIHRFPPQ